MTTANAKILNNIDESYFLNEKSLWNSFYVEEKHKDIIFLIYNKSKSEEYGLSEHDGDKYLRIIKVHKYLLKSKVDYIIEPIFLIENKSKEIHEVGDHYYDNLYDFHTVTDNHEILSYITYSHVLPDGKIIEHLHNPGMNALSLSIKDVYHETIRIRQSLILSQQLGNELPNNDEISSKRIKL
jgi:hypothetical protein